MKRSTNPRLSDNRRRHPSQRLWQWLGARYRIWFIMICVACGHLLLPSSFARAGTAGFQEYLIPGQETLLRTNYAAIDNNPTVGNSMHCVISVTASAEGTVVNYDHWENGYGTPDQVITLNTGQYHVFESASIPANPRGTGTYYDGGDRITVVGGPVFVTRASWPESPGVVMATAFEILPVQAMSTTFEMPVGAELNQNDRNKPFADFESVILMIQSTRDNNTITVKRPNNTVLWTGTLNKGQSVTDAALRQIQKGSTVAATYPVQIQFLTGRAVSNSASQINGFTGVPASLWSNKYSAPVISFTAGSASQINSRSDVYVYNPNTSAITITYRDSTTGTFTVAAKELASFAQKTGHYAPRNYGVWFEGSDTFWGFSETGSGYDTWDWGSVLVPDYYCRKNYVVGWAPGDLEGENNYSSVFVMARKPNTTVFVDYNQDNVVDQTLVLNFPQVAQITDPTDANMSGARIWGTDTLAMTYGEISGSPTPIGSPALDLGYTILPLAEEFVDQVLTIQKNVNTDTVVIGRPASFDIKVSAHSYVVGSITVTEHLPLGWQYVEGSTTLTFSNGSPQASAEPVITGNVVDGYTLIWNLGYTLNTDEYITLTFSAVPTSAAAEGVTQNCAEVSGSYGGTTFNPDDCMYMQTEKGATIGDHVWNDSDRDGIVDDGESGLAHIKLYLLGSSGALYDSTITNGVGDYLFAHVPHGSYSVQVVASSLPAGYTCTTGNQPLAVTVQAGDSLLTADFGYSQDMDYGDAPDPSYPTLLANNGARHVIIPGYYLGAGVDAEIDGQPSPDADGDDTDSAANDDDGVVFDSDFVPGDTAAVTVTASAAGLLNAWIDYNRDGDWNDQGEQIFINQILNAGSNILHFAVPATAAEGASFARFRFSTQGDLQPTGLAPDGEVEEYRITLQPAPADLRLDKSVDSAAPSLNANVVFTLHVVNDGPGAAGNVSVSDLLPNGLSYVSDSGQGSYDSGSGIWQIGAMAVHDSVTLQITAKVDSTGRRINTAEIVTSDRPDRDSTPDNHLFTEDDQDSAGVYIAQAADLELKKTAAKRTANVDTHVSFTLSLSNHGPDEATGVQVQDLLPAGLMFISESSNGNYNPATGIWSVGSLAVGRVDTLQIVTQITASGTIKNTAQVYSSDQYDPNSVPNNNNAEENDQDSVTVSVAAAADLQLAKTVNQPAPNLNSTVIYTLAVTNDGPDAASGVQVRDQLPAGLAWISDDGNGLYDHGTGLWNIGALAIHHTAVLHITAQVISFEQSNNTAEISRSDQFDPDSTPDNANALEDDQQSVVLSGQALDFGDAPAETYPTSESANGARHAIVPGIHLGAGVDADADGQGSGTATGDDSDNATNDEDGVVFTSAPSPGSVATVSITASADGFLNAWADFNRDGDWNDDREQIFNNLVMHAGGNSLTYQVPADAILGSTFFRFRFSSQQDLLPTGLAIDGEVEDYQVDVLLPVELAMFVAQVQNGMAVLQWTTQSETENIGFHIYRADSLHGAYRQISDVLIQGAGTTQAVHRYSYTDAHIVPGTTYYYKLADVDFKGHLTLHGPVRLEVPLPSEYELLMNYPNPFNPETKITFRTREAGFVRVNIYNLQGQLVRQLVSGQYNPGTFSAIWNGKDDNGHAVTSGIYIYTMEANGFKQSRKMNFIK